MKALVIGGVGQGKTEYVKNHFAPKALTDGEDCPLEEAFSGDGLTRLHLLIRRLMEAELDPVEFVERALENRESWVITCDEVGSGVVPVNGFEREWREQVGRICCGLARGAQRVERLCCGIPQHLKRMETEED